MSNKTEDAVTFGEGAWVYCSQHLRPHSTGWCTVGIEDKTKLEATDYNSAVLECRERGFKLHGHVGGDDV